MTLIINPILCRKGTMDNYAYIITDEKSKISAVIDASETEPIVRWCEKYNIKPEYIFTTHHHFDHVGANIDLKKKYGLKIIAPLAEKHLIDDVDIALKNNDEFFLGQTKVIAISASGHTKGHMLWYFENDKALFTGDVLFNLCIGGLFEGTPEQMFFSLEKIKSLPDDICFYPGHEYTKYCLDNMLKYNDTNINEYFNIAIQRINQGKPVAPINLGLEKKCNPYLKINRLEDFIKMF